MNWQLFTAFLLITLVLFLIPGPIVTLVIATSVSKGMRAGLITVAGTSCGTAVLLAVIALWLGIQAWRGAAGAAMLPPSDRVQFGRGFLVALSNPKTIAFFTAFLPQFIDPDLPAAPQLAAMCVVSVLLGAVSDSGWAVLAGLGRIWFMQPARAKLLGRLSGLALIGGGLWLSLSRRPV